MKKNLKSNALLMGIKTGLSLILPLITFPYITRILQVEALGKYNFSLSIINYFALIAELGITTYAIREGVKLKEDKEKFQCFCDEIITINYISTFFSYLLLIICTNIWFKAYDIYIFILSIKILSITFSKVWIYNVFEEFGIITVVQIFSQTLSLILLFLFVKNSDDLLIYCFTQMITIVLANVFYGINSKKYINYRPRFNDNLMRKHLKPILLLFCTALTGIIYVNSDITILGWLEGDYYVGIYSSAAKVYSIVKQLLTAIITVTIPRLSLLAFKKEFNLFFDKIFYSLLSLVLPAVVGLFMMSENIICIIAGEEYLLAVTSLQILSFSLLFALVGSLFSYGVLIPHKLENIFLISTIISAIVNVILNLALIPLYKHNAAAFSTLISEIIVTIICFIYMRKYCKIEIKKQTLLSIVLGNVSIILCCLLVFNLHFSLFIETVLSIGLSVTTYLEIQIFLKNESIIGVCNWIKAIVLNLYNKLVTKI